MKLEYIGHACFRLELDNGFAWVTDPYDGSIGLERPSVSATVTTLSHGHFDHNCVRRWTARADCWPRRARMRSRACASR